MQRDGKSSVFICQRFGHFSPSTKSTQPAGIRLGSIQRHEDEREREREMEIMTFILSGTTTPTYICGHIYICGYIYIKPYFALRSN